MNTTTIIKCHDCQDTGVNGWHYTCDCEAAAAAKSRREKVAKAAREMVDAKIAIRSKYTQFSKVDSSNMTLEELDAAHAEYSQEMRECDIRYQLAIR